MPGAISAPALMLPMKATASITRGQLVKVGSNEDEVLPSAGAAEAGVLGFAYNDAANGEHVTIQCSGVAIAKAGGSITLMQPLQGAASGAVTASAPSAGTNANCVGFALRAASSGDLFPVLVSRFVLQG